MATKPLTLTQGTTANATDVEAIFAPLYADIDSSNMDMASDFNFTGNLQQNGLELSRLLSRTSLIDGKSATTTNLLTVPTGKTAVITGLVVRITTATGLTGTLTAGVGVAAGEDDIIPATVCTGLNATGENFKIQPNGVSVEATASQVIKLGIDVAFGGTTVTLQVDLLGYYK
jgi:hypothetical protein